MTIVAVTKQNELNKAWRDHVASIHPGAFAGPNLCFVVGPAFDPPKKAGDNLERQWKERGAQIMAPGWKYEPGEPWLPRVSQPVARAPVNGTKAPHVAQARQPPVRQMRPCSRGIRVRPDNRPSGSPASGS